MGSIVLKNNFVAIASITTFFIADRLLILTLIFLHTGMVTKWAADLMPPPTPAVNIEDETTEDTPVEPVPKKPKNLNIRSKYLLKQLSGSSSGGSTSSVGWSPHQIAKKQMDMYLSFDHGEIELNADGEPVEINPIRFWVDNHSTMPALAKLANIVLSVPASSAPVERVFSHGGIIFRPHRRRLNDHNLSQLIFLKCNRLKLNKE